MWSGATQPREAPLSVACLKARGNAMEIAVGLAWAAWTDGTNLREGHTIEWDGSKEAWIKAWTQFNVRGLAPKEAFDAPAAGKAANATMLGAIRAGHTKESDPARPLPRLRNQRENAGCTSKCSSLKRKSVSGPKPVCPSLQRHQPRRFAAIAAIKKRTWVSPSDARRFFARIITLEVWASSSVCSNKAMAFYTEPKRVPRFAPGSKQSELLAKARFGKLHRQCRTATLAA